MDQIEVASSEDVDESSSHISYHQSDLFYQQAQERDIQRRQPSNDLEESTTPTYRQVMTVMRNIRVMYPQLSMNTVLTRLLKLFLPHSEPQTPKRLFNFQTKQEKNTFVRQCQYAAKGFVQLGYGISRMRTQISKDKVNLQISDASKYEKIINCVFYTAYVRLQKFLIQKCRNDVYRTKIIPLRSQFQRRSALQFMKFARKQMSFDQIHCFFKILKSTYEIYPINLSKFQACKLYAAVHHYIQQKKKKGEIKMFDLPIKQDESQNEQKKQQIWTEAMTQALADLYIRQPNILNYISSQLKATYHCSESLLQNNIKNKLAFIIRSSIDRVQSQMDRPECLELGSRFKRLVRIDEGRINAIIEEPQAMAVRVAICQFFKIKHFNINSLMCTILSINEFMNKRENQEIARNLELTRQRNSICRQEYEFAGKRRKVLILKNRKKEKEVINFQ